MVANTDNRDFLTIQHPPLPNKSSFPFITTDLKTEINPESPPGLYALFGRRTSWMQVQFIVNGVTGVTLTRSSNDVRDSSDSGRCSRGKPWRTVAGILRHGRGLETEVSPDWSSCHVEERPFPPAAWEMQRKGERWKIWKHLNDKVTTPETCPPSAFLLAEFTTRRRVRVAPAVVLRVCER